MKKLLYIAVLAFLFNACGGGGGDTPTPPPATNNPPSTPSLVFPGTNELCIDNAVTFSWNASTDPDGDAISYKFDVALDQNFSNIQHTITSSVTSHTLSLDKGVAYYWRVLAKDSKNAESAYSTINPFYTEGDGESNQLPFAPALVAPALNAVISENTVTLSWTATDADGDPLTYDVYFETGDTPTTQVATNISETSFEVSLAAESSYSWKVVVKDDKGGQTEGQVWTFKTD